jgi:hypothetical protein
MAQLNALFGLSEGATDPALHLFATALGALSIHDRREFLLVAASVLEGKLPDSIKSQVCVRLRILAGET